MYKMLTETELENWALEQFRSQGWEVLNGAALERDDFRSVVLRDRLLAALRRINPGIPESALDDAADQVCKLQSLSMEENNREFHKLLLNSSLKMKTNGIRLNSLIFRMSGTITSLQ